MRKQAVVPNFALHLLLLEEWIFDSCNAKNCHLSRLSSNGRRIWREFPSFAMESKWIIFHFERGTTYSDEHFVIELTNETVRDVTQILAQVFGVHGSWLFSYQRTYLADPAARITSLPGIADMSLISISARPAQTVTTLRGSETDVRETERSKLTHRDQHRTTETQQGRAVGCPGQIPSRLRRHHSEASSGAPQNARRVRSGSGSRRGFSLADCADQTRLAVRTEYQKFTVEQKADFDRVRLRFPNVNDDELLELFITTGYHLDDTLQLAGQ
jgi:hypothetical protein